MGLSHKAVQISFALNASLILFLVSYFYPQTLQGTADALLANVSADPHFRLYAFDAIIFAVFFLVAVFSIRGIKHSAVDEYEAG